MPLFELAGVYETGLGFTGQAGALSPLVIGDDESVTIAGTRVPFTYDAVGRILDIQPIQIQNGPAILTGRLVFNVDLLLPGFQGTVAFDFNPAVGYNGKFSAYLRRIALGPSSMDALTSHIATKRATHQAPPLAWEAGIAMAAQGWANHNIDSYLLTSRNDPGNWSALLQHSTNPYGENIYVESGQLFDAAYVESASIRAVDNWYSEVSNYDFTPPGGKSLPGKGVFGHFTCLVWKASVTFGIGLSALVDPANRVLASVVVLNTSPAGNVAGQYNSNVLPAV